MRKKKILAVFMIVFTVMLSSFSFYFWQMIYTPNILVDKQDQYFPIPPGTTFKDIQNRLYDEGIVNDLVSFSFLSKIKKYDDRVMAGMYLLRSNMSNNEAINLLRSGRQTPVRLTFNNARLLSELAPKLTANLAIDSATMAPYLQSDSIAKSYGFDSLNFISMFLPNTYEVYWTATPSEILNRMKQEYEKFWTPERKEKASKIGLTPEEVSVLASIVDSETNYMEEAPTVAGVYINRLKKGYKLQADPTLKFALGDFTIRRILNVHKHIDSPYNTYKYAGLPPGPIRMPSIATIEAVLNAEEHQYLYFCASPDFSGKHIFAKTLIEHNRNAERLHQALNQQNIYR